MVCSIHVEDTLHLLICNFAHRVWSMVHAWMELYSVLPLNVRDYGTEDYSQGKTHEQAGLIIFFGMWFCLSLWLLHADGVFFKNVCCDVVVQ